MKKLILILVAVAICAAIAITAVVLLTGNSTPETPETQETPETPESSGVTKEEWNSMIADHNFENYTLMQEGHIIQDDETESIQTGTVKITKDKVSIDMTITQLKVLGEEANQTFPMKEVFSGEMATMQKGSYEDVFRALIAEYESFVWDAEKKLYKNPKDLKISFPAGDGVTAEILMTNGEVKLDENGKLLEFAAKFDQEIKDADGTKLATIKADMKWAFSAFGTTVIE